MPLNTKIESSYENSKNLNVDRGGTCLGLLAVRKLSFVLFCFRKIVTHYSFLTGTAFRSADAHFSLAKIRCLGLFAFNGSTVFLFRNFVSSKEKTFALCSQVAKPPKR